MANKAPALFDHSHCESISGQDLTDKVLVLDPAALDERFRMSDYQCFIARGGFGCKPSASGRKVFGEFMKDGEQTNFYRSEFIGELKEEHYPDYVKEAKQKMEAPAHTQNMHL